MAQQHTGGVNQAFYGYKDASNMDQDRGQQQIKFTDRATGNTVVYKRIGKDWYDVNNQLITDPAVMRTIQYHPEYQRTSSPASQIAPWMKQTDVQKQQQVGNQVYVKLKTNPNAWFDTSGKQVNDPTVLAQLSDSVTYTGPLVTESTITEGGNVFKDQKGNSLTTRIRREQVVPTVKWLEDLTGLSLLDNMLGTTGKKETSGDLDLAVDASKISKETLIRALMAKDIDAQDIKKSGDSVHLKTPIQGGEGFVQTDFMFGEPKWQQFSMQGSPEDSQYKGMHRHVLLASIAKAMGMKWSYKNGLMDRESNTTIEGGKDPKVIGKLLGIPATKLGTFEDILAAIKGRPEYEQLIADAREALSRDNLKLPESAPMPGTAAWFRSITGQI